MILSGYIDCISSCTPISRLGLERLADLFKATKHVSGRVPENARSCHWLSAPLLGTSAVGGAPSDLAGRLAALTPGCPEWTPGRGRSEPGLGPPGAPPAGAWDGTRRSASSVALRAGAQGAEQIRERSAPPGPRCPPRPYSRRRAASRRE